MLTYTPSYPSINSVGNAYQFIGKKMLTCTICEKELEGMKRVFCSEACSSKNQQNLVKNPLSTYGTGKRKQMVYEPAAYHSSYDESHLPQSVELYIANLPDQPFTEEDQRYLNRCLDEMGPATIDEKIYVSPNLKTKRLGLYNHATQHPAYYKKNATLKAYERRMSRKDY